MIPKSCVEYFTDNKIESLGPHSLFVNNQTLELYIDLGENRIATIDDSAFVSPTGEFQRFDYLGLSGNPLKELSQSIFEPLMVVSNFWSYG